MASSEAEARACFLLSISDPLRKHPSEQPATQPVSCGSLSLQSAGRASGGAQHVPVSGAVSVSKLCGCAP